MTGLLLSGLRLLRARAATQRLTLLATGLMALLAATLLATPPIYTDAVVSAGLPRTIEEATAPERTIDVLARVSGDDEAADASVDDLVDDTLPMVDVVVHRAGASRSFDIVGTELLTELRFRSGLDDHVRWEEGGPPHPGQSPREAVVHAAAAAHLDLQVGDAVSLTGRAADADADVRVVGIYTPVAPDQPYWADEELATTGTRSSGGFTYAGPFLVAPADLPAALGDDAWQATWRHVVVPDSVQIEDAGPLSGALRQLDRRLDAEARGGADFEVDTELSSLLEAEQSRVAATRASVLVTTVQLAVLAAYGLVVALGFLLAGRDVQIALLRARGASAGQLAVTAVVEGLALVVPAVLVAPWLAVLVVRLVGTTDLLTAAGLTIAPTVSGAAYALAATAGVLTITALTVTTYRRSDTFAAAQARSGRGRVRSVLARSGADVLLAISAVIALWQLRSYGGAVTTGPTGRAGIDPLLVAAPAVALLAGAVLTLRLLPLAARGAEQLAARRRGLGLSLGAWELARRPGAFARTAVALTLTVAAGTFAVAYARTWDRALQDQAALEVGTDVRVMAPAAGAAAPAIGPLLGRTGADAVATAATDTLTAGSTDSATALALSGDPREVVRVRDDLWRTDPALDELDAQRPRLPAVELPSGSRELRVDVTVGPLANADVGPPPDTVRLTAILSGEGGVLHPVDLGPAPTNGTTTTLAPERSPGLPPDRDTSLVGFDLRATAQPQPLPQPAPQLRVRLAPSTEDGRSVSMTGWRSTVRQPPGASTPATVEPPRAGAAATEVIFSPGAVTLESGARTAVLQLRAGPAPTISHLPAVSTTAFLADTGARVGDTIEVRLAGRRQELRIVGATSALPGLAPPDEPAVLIDLPTWQAAAVADGGDVPAASGWWVATDDGAAVAAAIRDSGLPVSSVDVREDRVVSARRDPVAVGAIAMLLVGAVAAYVLAVVAAVLSAATRARQHATETAVLRAMGTPRRTISRFLLVEQALALGVALAVGLSLAVLVAELALPAVAHGADGGPALPPALVVLPGPGLWGVLAVGATALLCIPLLTARALHRHDVADVLRRAGDP